MAPDKIEAVLTEIWRRNFGPRGPNPDGHLLNSSMGMLRLTRFLQESEATLGCKIPPSALLRLGTVKAVAAAIHSGIWPESSPLILLRDGRTDCAVYFVSSGEGVVLQLCDLIAFIDCPGQIWGLQLAAFDGESEPLKSMQEIAQHYVDAILKHAGTATIHHIVGYSFGGLVAVEMARILRAEGYRIGLLGLLDTTCYEKYWPLSQWLVVALRKARRRVFEIRTMSSRVAVEYLANKTVKVFHLFRRRLALSPGASSPCRSIYYVGGLEPNLQRVRDASIIAFETYNPQPINCKIVLFKPTTSAEHIADPVAIWKRRTSDLEVVHVEGKHLAMVRNPFAKCTAAEISRHLARASTAERENPSPQPS
jgi:thioesterase domain-containing protein